MTPLAPSSYLAELLDASRRFPRVALVLVQLGTGRLHVLRGDDPHLADQLETYLCLGCFPVAILGFGPEPDHVSVEPVGEYKNEPWMPRYLLLLGEQIRRELDRTPSFGRLGG